MSPYYPLMDSLCSARIGRGQTGSNASLLAATSSDFKSSSFVKSPAVSSPRATLHAPVKVAMSMICFGLNCY